MKCLGAFVAMVVLCLGVTQAAERVHGADAQTAAAPPEPSEARSTATPYKLDAPGSFGPRGPWAGYQPQAPRPKPPDWIDPEPSRWPWTGERDPYDDTGRIQWHPCAQAQIGVAADSPDERRLACSAAEHAIELLGRCGISPRKPLKVQIQSEVRHPLGGAIFGMFDTKEERALVTHEASIPALVQDTPYAKLPQRDFYRSLIVHETVHAVMHQNLKRPASSHAAHEYPAYALQIESLAPKVREEFLRSFDQAAISAGAITFNDPILLFDPYFFAARAYHHFKAAADPCAHLHSLLQDVAAFIAPPAL
jgi:hypothetical protein